MVYNPLQTAVGYISVRNPDLFIFQNDKIHHHSFISGIFHPARFSWNSDFTNIESSRSKRSENRNNSVHKKRQKTRNQQRLRHFSQYDVLSSKEEEDRRLSLIDRYKNHLRKRLRTPSILEAPIFSKINLKNFESFAWLKSSSHALDASNARSILKFYRLNKHPPLKYIISPLEVCFLCMCVFFIS